MEIFPFPEKRPKQEELMAKFEETIEDNTSLVAHAPTGLGKCVSGETTILTGNGFRKLEDLNPGEDLDIISFDENLKQEDNIGKLVKKKKADTLQISTGTGRKVKVTPDHKVLRLKNGEVEWIRSDELHEDDFIASPQNISLPEIEFAFTLADLRNNTYSDSLRIKFTGMEEVMEFFEDHDRELEDKTDIPRKNFTKLRRNKPVKLKYCLKLVELSNINKNELEITEIHYNNKNKIRLPEIDEDFCYFLGMMLGDGSIIGKRETIGFSTQDQEMEDLFRKEMKKFNSKVREVHGDKYGYKSSNRSLAFLLKELGLPSGIKENMKVPDCVLTSKNNLSSFLSGLLDTDGSIDLQGKLELTTKSKQLSTQLLIAFSIFGIRPIRKEKTIEGKEYYRLFISNQKELEKLRENIGFKIKRKEKRLEEAVEREYNPNKNLIPEISEVIKQARRKSDIPYSRKTLRRRLESYETGSRSPSREGLTELLEHYNWKEDDKNFQKIKKLIESDVYWDKIEKIETKEREKVYDLNEPKNHNFAGNNLILHNTAATVTPALEKTLESDGTVFFLTPRHSQHEIALETVKKINNRHSENIISVDLIGKDHLCEADGVTREGPSCPRHSETFDGKELSKKAWKKIHDLKHQNLRAEELKKRCQDVCAYTISMYMCQEADIVIADYFHIFHPGIRSMVTEISQASIEDSILIVDEAHNLPSRTRSLFSFSVSQELVDNCITEAEKFGYYQEQENLEQLRTEIQRLARDKLDQKDHQAEVEKQDLKDPIDNFHSFEEMIVDLEAIGEEVQEEEEKSFCAKLAEALDGWKGDDEGFFRFIERNRQGSDRTIRIKYTCLDPSISTSEPLNNSKASVMMSGTLKPQKMYVDLLGLENAKTIEFKSPFPKENKLELAVNTLTTRYKERDQSMIQKYVWYLEKSLEEVNGNAAVFFPSYQLMNQIGEQLNERTDRQVLMEKRRNSKEDNQTLLDRFKNGKDGVLLGVASGSFGEGVDYPGEMMKAVFVVGLPLRKPDLKTEALIDYLDEKYGKGWQYGYTYPGINTAVQAAGRCIRSKTDKGIICYMDKRYTWNKYGKLLENRPEETRAPWQEIKRFQEE